MHILKKSPTEAHPYIPELKEQYRQGKVTRREFLRLATLLGMSAASAKYFVGDALAAPITAPRAVTRGGTMTALVNEAMPL